MIFDDAFSESKAKGYKSSATEPTKLKRKGRSRKR
jgi:hypothetical protein